MSPAAYQGVTQGGFTHVWAIGGSNADDWAGVLLALKAVQLCQQLVQRLLPLIVAHAAQPRVPSCATQQGPHPISAISKNTSKKYERIPEHTTNSGEAAAGRGVYYS